MTRNLTTVEDIGTEIRHRTVGTVGVIQGSFPPGFQGIAEGGFITYVPAENKRLMLPFGNIGPYEVIHEGRRRSQEAMMGQVSLVSDESKTYPNGANDRMIRIKAGDYTYIFEHITFPRNPRGHVIMTRIDPHYPNHTSYGSRKIKWDPERLIAHLGQKQPALAQLLSQLIGNAAQPRQVAQPVHHQDLQAAARFLGGPQSRSVPWFNEKSKGHIAFDGDVEYFEVEPPLGNGEIYSALKMNTIDLNNGYRTGARFVATRVNAAEIKARLKGRR